MNKAQQTEKVFMFPIPGSVTCPGMLFPLHVFEPRYRKMVTQAIEENRLLGIGLTQKVIKEAKKDQSLVEKLNTNQATYKPLPVFSAGYCKLIETKEDGRLLVDVDIRSRFRIVKAIQTLPFSIYECSRIEDLPLTESDEQYCDQLRDKILHRLAALTANLTGLGQNFLGQQWFDLALSEFSFQLQASFRLPAPIAQELLELTSTKDRLDRIMHILNN